MIIRIYWNYEIDLISILYGRIPFLSTNTKPKEDPEKNRTRRNKEEIPAYVFGFPSPKSNSVRSSK